MLNADALYSGTLIAERDSVDAVAEGIPLTVAKVSWARVAGGPELWTFIDFEVAADRAAGLAEALSRVLEREGGWYCDFRSDDEVFVVFCDRVLPYRRGDRAARSAVEDHARSTGVPESRSTGPDSGT